MTPAPIRVMIVDDHAMIRRGLRAYLLGRADMVVVGEAGDGQEALDTLDAVQPEVILMDLQMPRMGGIEAAGLIHRRNPAAKIIVLTSIQDPELTDSALQAGASGFLLKDAPEEDLVAAIRLAHAGHRLIPPGASPRRKR